jgi:hypothetical protein
MNQFDNIIFISDKLVTNIDCPGIVSSSYESVKLPRGLGVRLERFQVMAIVWEWRRMLPAELR